MLLRVGIVNAVHPRPFQQHVGLYLYAAERCGTVGRKTRDWMFRRRLSRRIPCSGNPPPCPWSNTPRPAPCIWKSAPSPAFPSARSADSRASELMTVASIPIWSPFTRSNPLSAPCMPRNMFPPPNNYADLHAGPGDFPYLRRIRTEYPGRKSVLSIAGQRLAAQFQQYSLIFHLTAYLGCYTTRRYEFFFRNSYNWVSLYPRYVHSSHGKDGL